MEILKPLLTPFAQYKFEIVFILISAITGITAGILFYTSTPLPSEGTKTTTNYFSKPVERSVAKTFFIDISGAVLKPDSYEVTAGARLKDILVLSGGLSEVADKGFFNRNFNLSKILVDQQKIYIPSINDIQEGLFSETTKVLDFTQPTKITSTTSLPTTSKPSINTATLADLDKITNISKTLAQKIIDGRPYGSIDDLLEKKILTKTTFDKVKNLLDL
jgi:competence protein ComEA